MPAGQLFLRTKQTVIAAAGSGDKTGIITTNLPTWAGNKAGWTDAYLRYGLSLEDGAASKLMTYAPQKQPTGSNRAGHHGVAYMGSTIGKKDELMLSFDVHIMAPDKTTFLSRYALFNAEIIECGYIQLYAYCRSAIRHLIYQDCQQFQQFSFEMAKFALSFIEPHPEITDHREPSIIQVS